VCTTYSENVWQHGTGVLKLCGKIYIEGYYGVTVPLYALRHREDYDLIS
jgi:hypothetical protein